MDHNKTNYHAVNTYGLSAWWSLHHELSVLFAFDITVKSCQIQQKSTKCLASSSSYVPHEMSGLDV